MQYLYTTEPDERCKEVSQGIYRRVVQSYQVEELKAKGWVKDASKLTKKSDSKEEAKETAQEESVLTRDELAKSLGIPLHDDEGKKRHYKLIQGDIEKAQADEHNQG